jgi:hypothetical protein
MDVPLPAQMRNMHYARDAAHLADYDGTDIRFGTVLDPHRRKGAGKATTMTVVPARLPVSETTARKDCLDKDRIRQ